MQSKRKSALAAGTNVLVGYLVAVAANYLVLPAFGYMVSVSDSFSIGLVFMAIGFARSYALRRIFNWWL